MQLSKNFTLEEMVKSDTAKRLRIRNCPSKAEIDNLLFLSLFILQPIRNFTGRVNVTSGYRCQELNDAIKGSKTSQHRLGQAADIRTPSADLKKVFYFIRDNLKFGQVIYECPEDGREPWIHISLPRTGKENQQCLTWNGSSYYKTEGRL